MNFIFDIDGTLTPSRGLMDPTFKEWFLQFIKQNSVMLVTGSDFDKTVEQVGLDIVENVEYCFNCSGNVVMHKGEIIFKREFTLPEDLVSYLLQTLVSSPYPHLYGKHLEDRIYMANYSVVGRGANKEQRADYYAWDNIHGQRISIAKEINSRWPTIQAVVGGETGIDLFDRGCDKSQIVKYLPAENVFFGDRMDPDGNDYPLMQSIIHNNLGKCYKVNDWTDTQKILLEQIYLH